MLEKINLTYTQYIVMMYFWEKEKSNVKDIGKTIMLDSSTLTPLLKKLEKKGYITRIRSTIDERNLEVAITEKGKKLREKIITVPGKIGACMNLSKDEAENLYSLMYKVLINIERNDNK